MNNEPENARVGGGDAVTAAPFWRRVLADLIDAALLAVVSVLLWASGLVTPAGLPDRRFDWIDYGAQLLADHHAQFYPFIALALVVHLVALSVQRRFLRATFGDLVLGLELVDHRGEEPAVWQGVVHSLGTTVGVLLLLQGYAWAAVDKERQGLSNYLSRTLLVRRD